MALKQDEDFLRFLTMGAAGTAAVLDALDRDHGHRMVELERYATANKIWANKIKRLRLADLLCLDCGIRVEVRAKSRLAIRMSHSQRPGREWDAGLRDDDLVAFVAWRNSSLSPSPHHHYFRVGDMRSTAGYARWGARKAASEGAEQDITWPATVPGRSGTVIEIDYASGVARYRFQTGRTQTYRLQPQGIPVHPYALPGQALTGGEQFIFGCVKAPETIQCRGRRLNLDSLLGSEDAVDRYVAVKAAGIDSRGRDLEKRLKRTADDPNEDLRIRLEAWGSLARMNPPAHVPRLREWVLYFAAGSSKDQAFSMEGILILSELGSPEAVEALIDLASCSGLGSESRSAAVWGLGTTGADDSRQVLPFIADPDDDVALHALACMGALDDALLGDLQEMLLRGTDRETASAAALLVEEGEPGIVALLKAAQRDDRSSLRAQAALARLSETEVREAAGGFLTSRLEAILAPAWVDQTSWLRSQETRSPLDLLRLQCVRHLGRGG
jgi:hypothetical protein